MKVRVCVGCWLLRYSRHSSVGLSWLRFDRGEAIESMDQRGFSPKKETSPLKRSAIAYGNGPASGNMSAQMAMPSLRTPSGMNVARPTEVSVPSEPIQTYLRIRPPSIDERDNRESSAPSYVEVLSDTQVMMHAPPEVSLSKSRLRTNPAAPVKYTFSHVFAPHLQEENNTSRSQVQADFFTMTTLPLVQDVLKGKNSLVFTYGVTNSGKTYTVQGLSRNGEAGILPRALNVIFNSIHGRECTKAVRPMGLNGVQPGVSDPSQSLLSGRIRPRTRLKQRLNPIMGQGSTSTVIANAINTGISDTAKQSDELWQDHATKVDVLENVRYSVWVSYVEVYNEKLYDLLESPTPSLLSRAEHDVPGADTDLGALASPSVPAAARRPLLLKSEAETGGKYVSGLKEIKVNNIQEARELLRCGQENRSVFGTMANQSSSRSHSVFTIKILRENTSVEFASSDSAGLSRKYSVSRLSIVDLAGSERISNTDISTGPRLKEAGSINKSLMCLGQCLETMRKNQARAGIGASLSSSRSEESRKRRPSIVPFRHSKLTELFQSFFMGDGKVIMIVNVNPSGTGFEESSNVMRFSAMAKEVGIQVSSPASTTTVGPSTSCSDSLGSHHASDAPDASVLDASFNTEKLNTSDDDVDNDDEEQDEFVNMLLAENERLRLRCERAENLCRIVEKNVRDEMGQQLEAGLKKMQRFYERQLQAEIDASDAFMDRKIDLFARLSQAVEHEPSSAESSACDESEDAASPAPPSQFLAENHDYVNVSPGSQKQTSRKSSLKSTVTSSDESHDTLLVANTPSPSRRFRKLAQRPAIQTDEMDQVAFGLVDAASRTNTHRTLR